MTLRREGSLSPKFKAEYAELVEQFVRNTSLIRSFQQRITLLESIISKLK
jgi:hypothetical protein